MKQLKNASSIVKFAELMVETANKYNEAIDLGKWKVDAVNSTIGNLKNYDCVECLNRGCIAIPCETDGHRMRECECMAIRKSLKMIEKSGLKPLMERYTFENYITRDPWQKKVKGLAQRFIDDNACFFAMLGQTGAGKSHVCTAIATEYLNRRTPVYYMLWNTDVKRLRSTVNDGVEHEKEVKRLQTIDVLYIDDLFKCKNGNEPSDADVRLAFEIINARYNSRATTLISSEFTIDELRGIDAALAGRINEMCGVYILNIGRDEKKNYRWRKPTQ